MLELFKLLLVIKTEMLEMLFMKMQRIDLSDLALHMKRKTLIYFEAIIGHKARKARNAVHEEAK